jgi:hypothetical protein
VASFLATDRADKSNVDDALAGVNLSPTEAATVTEAFTIGSGVYTRAADELSLVEKPYSAAARKVLGKDYKKVVAQKEAALPAPAVAPALEATSYSPRRIDVGPVSPYTMARREYNVDNTKPLAEAAAAAPAVAIEIADDDEIKKKMALLEKNLKDGKISKEQYQQLKSKYTEAKPALPVKDKAEKAYKPEYMFLRSDKPYDMAAKRVKLDQQLREGKISRRLYEELIGNYQ